AQKIDLAIFPGEQGGPHVNKFAAMAVAFTLAQTDQFQALQKQIVKNAAALAEGLTSRGLRLAYGGTDTHLLLLDLKSISPPAAPPTGAIVPIWGEPAVRILDLAGMVCNKNTIPGDMETSLATGIRLGTPWLTQRGLIEKDMDTLAGLIHKLLSNLKPYFYQGLSGVLPRAKIDRDVLEEVRTEVAGIAKKAGIDMELEGFVYPHYQEIDHTGTTIPGQIKVTGFRARQFLNQITPLNLLDISIGEKAVSFILNEEAILISEVEITRVEQDSMGRDVFILTPPADQTEVLLSWLRGISDGYILFDRQDLLRKVEGPVIVELVSWEVDPFLPAVEAGAAAIDLIGKYPQRFDMTKPYFIGVHSLPPGSTGAAREKWSWSENEAPLKKTELYHVHQKMGAKLVPFAGWEMPVRYSSIMEEHRAVREGAGLFDVSHMGVFEISGPNATPFLDIVFSNYAAWLNDGQSLYGYLLAPDGNVIDDGIIYRVSPDYYYLVINASNEDKDWDWLNAVNDGDCCIDNTR
ncbi:MAG: hypothetical protein MUP11_10635, partial [Anaerolineales bacterium]|nr:hypothetical protein [Anaerolineales bacterium]